MKKSKTGQNSILFQVNRIKQVVQKMMKLQIKTLET